MRNLAILTFLTLDGVMQAPGSPEEDPSDGFVHGGWAVNYWDEVMAQVMEEAMAAPYDLLIGRKTYESFAAHWPNAGDNPVANKMNNAKKYVATSTLSKLDKFETRKIKNHLERRDHGHLQARMRSDFPIIADAPGSCSCRGRVRPTGSDCSNQPPSSESFPASLAG